MKKKNKPLNKNTSFKTSLLHVLKRLKYITSTHGVLIMFLLAGVAIGLALYRSQGYLSPTRDENKYNELIGAANYSKIDDKLVKKLQEAFNDTDVTVSAKLDPDRKNPFSE